MLDIKEYEYEKSHLNDKEALERFKLEKSRHPNSIVTFDELDCGHYIVNVHSSDREKRQILNKRMSEMIERFLNAFIPRFRK